MAQPTVPVPGGVLYDILNRLTALENQAGQSSSGAEALEPNYLTVSPSGQVSANFSGVVNALGLTIPSSISGGSPTAANQIEWIRTSDGAVVANIFGSNSGSGFSTALSLTADSPDSTGSAANLTLSGNYSGSNVSVTVGSAVRLLLDGSGESSFLQLLGSSLTNISGGQSSATWSGGSSSATATVNHNIGRVPSIAIAADVDAHGVWYACNALTTTQAGFFGQATGPLTLASQFCWVCIG